MTLAPRTVLFLPRYAPPCELRNIPRLRRVSRRGISTAVPAAYPVKHPMLVRAGRSGLHARVSIERSRPVLREFVRKLAATRSSAAGVSGDSKLAEVARSARMEVICSASGAAVECRAPANRQATNRPHYVIDGSHDRPRTRDGRVALRNGSAGLGPGRCLFGPQRGPVDQAEVLERHVAVVFVEEIEKALVVGHREIEERGKQPVIAARALQPSSHNRAN